MSTTLAFIVFVGGGMLFFIAVCIILWFNTFGWLRKPKE